MRFLNPEQFLFNIDCQVHPNEYFLTVLQPFTEIGLFVKTTS
jgi:hypothetical protein